MISLGSEGSVGLMNWEAGGFSIKDNQFGVASSSRVLAHCKVSA